MALRRASLTIATLVALGACRGEPTPGRARAPTRELAERGPEAGEAGEVDEADAATTAELAAPEPTPCTEPCEPTRLLETRYPKNVLVDERHVYFIQADALRRFSRDARSAAEVEVEVVLEDVEPDLALLSDAAIYLCRDAPNAHADILRVAKDGAAPTIVARASVCMFARLGDQLYFLTRDKDWKTWISRAPHTGGEPERLFVPERGPDQLVADDRYLYFRARNDIHRYDPATRADEIVVADAHQLYEIGVTDSHLVWLDQWELFRQAKAGGAPELVATFQDARQFVSAGGSLYWPGDEGWLRLAADGSLVRHPADNSHSLAVAGTRVWWNEFDKQGTISTLETCACTDDVLTPVPTRPAIQGPAPDEIADLRLGWVAEDGQLWVPLRDLSPDEGIAADQVYSQRGDGPIAIGSAGLPARFTLGEVFRVANSHAVFEAELTSFALGSGAEGVFVYLVLRAKPGPLPGGEGGLVAALGGPKLGLLRPASADVDLARVFLPALVAATKAANVHGERIEAKHIEVVRGSFPGGHEVILTLDLGLSDDDDGELTDGSLSGLWFGDASGKITATLVEPKRRLDHFRLDYLVDVDGDGADEVGFTSSYYEGSFNEIVRWNGTTPYTETLEGDGA